MILLVNTFITDNRLSPHFKWERGFLPLDNRLDVFKYSLASFAAINRWSNIYLNIKLDDNYQDRWQELHDYICELFPNSATVRYFRCDTQENWQELYNEIFEINKDELIWFCCNDDHVFMDYDLSSLDEILLSMRTNPSYYKACYFSHWPELLRIAEKQNAVMVDNHLEFNWHSNDSVQIITKEIMHYMFFRQDYGDVFMPRPDFKVQVEAPDALFYVPLREMCRHYDGYNHVNIPQSYCPALKIPPGFFEKNIKIRYGYEKNKKDWVNVNPNKLFNTAVDINGADYKCLLEDLPLFWKNHISEVDINPDFEYDNFGRDNAHLQLACSQYNLKMFKDSKWITKQMR